MSRQFPLKLRTRGDGKGMEITRRAPDDDLSFMSAWVCHGVGKCGVTVQRIRVVRNKTKVRLPRTRRSRRTTVFFIMRQRHGRSANSYLTITVYVFFMVR